MAREAVSQVDRGARSLFRSSLAAALAALLGCHSPERGAGAGSANGAAVEGSSMTSTPGDTARSPWATDGRLEIMAEVDPQVTVDRVPMRALRLRLRNATSEPLRIYMPRPDAFRFGISSVVFTPKEGSPLLVPEPRPHGYMIGEDDFILLAPREERVVTQSFTIDPMSPGRGVETARRPGFEKGKVIAVRWTYENAMTAWPGGAQTLDGVTKPLFGGGPIPHLWTGKLKAELTWIVPD